MTFKDHLLSVASALRTFRTQSDFMPGTTGKLPIWVAAGLTSVPMPEMAVYTGEAELESIRHPRVAAADEIELDESLLVFGC